MEEPKPKCLNYCEVGSRVWAGETGTITSAVQQYFSSDQKIYTVKWDTGRICTVYANQFKPIGTCKSWQEFVEWVVSQGEKCEAVYGPAGGLRSEKIIFRNGDWVWITNYGLRPNLEAANIPITIEKLARKKRLPPL